MLEVKTYKNWKEICEAMEWKTTGGTYKKARLKELESMCNYHKDGNKFIIEEIYEEKRFIEDGRKNYKNNYAQYKINKKFDNSIGVYRIINYKTKEVYIGSTTNSFRKRFIQHYENYNKNSFKTCDLIHNGGEFEILEEMNDSTEKEIRLREQYYINEYLKDDNYILINHFNEVSYKGKRKYFTKIKIDKKDLEFAIKILNENGIEIY